MAMVTSQEANKLLKKLDEEIQSWKILQENNKTFTAATIENKEELRPEFNFFEVQNQIAILEEKVRTIKHAINIFNCTTEIKALGVCMTIDQALVFLPQLTNKKYILGQMKDVPEQRRKTVNGNIIDYTYRNYSLEDVNSEYDAACDLLTAVQNELNLVNATVKFEIPD